MPTYLTQALRAELIARKVPYELVYGPEHMTQGPRSRSHIVLKRDDQAGDGWGPPKSRTTTNPTYRYTRMIGFVLLVFVESTKAGASVEDHEDVADAVVNQLGLALQTIMHEQRSQWRPRTSRFLTAAELEEANLSAWPGRVYMLPFEIDQGIYDTGWDLDEAYEAEAGGDDGFATSTTLDTSGETFGPSGLPGATTRKS